MFIGYYKSVTSSKEFYSEKRKDLNFPIQVEYKGDRYLLNKTIQVSSNSHENNINKNENHRFIHNHPSLNQLHHRCPQSVRTRQRIAR